VNQRTVKVEGDARGEEIKGDCVMVVGQRQCHGII
jgi:hypothetical protein